METNAPQSWQMGNAQCCSWQLDIVQENLHYKEDTILITSSASTHNDIMFEKMDTSNWHKATSNTRVTPGE